MGWIRSECRREDIIRLRKNNRWRVNRVAGLTHPITPCLGMIVLCVVVIDGMTGHWTREGDTDQKKRDSQAHR